MTKYFIIQNMKTHTWKTPKLTTKWLTAGLLYQTKFLLKNSKKMQKKKAAQAWLKIRENNGRLTDIFTAFLFTAPVIRMYPYGNQAGDTPVIFDGRCKRISIPRGGMRFFEKRHRKFYVRERVLTGVWFLPFNSKEHQTYTKYP